MSAVFRMRPVTQGWPFTAEFTQLTQMMSHQSEWLSFLIASDHNIAGLICKMRIIVPHPKIHVENDMAGHFCIYHKMSE